MAGWTRAGRYAGRLEANDVDLETLEELSDQDLKDLGVVILGHRRKLLKAIRERAPARGDGPGAPASHRREDPHVAGRLEGERKHVTVMFADVSGFTTLPSVDPEEVHGIMDAPSRSSARVHRYEGTINQFLGDGIMALFGAPIAHEDHARARRRRARIQRVEAASGADVERRHGLDFRMRSGSTPGPSWWRDRPDLADGLHRARADTVNPRARLEEMAEAGLDPGPSRTRAHRGRPVRV